MKNSSILDKLPDWLISLVGITFGIQIFIAFTAVCILTIACMIEVAIK